MASPFKDTATSKLLLDHVDSYSRASRAAAQQLERILQDLELTQPEQRDELDQICARAANVWTQAVEEATGRRNELRERIEDALKEVQKIKAQLGDDAIQAEIESEIAQLQVGASGRRAASTPPPPEFARAACRPRSARPLTAAAAPGRRTPTC